MSDDFGKENQGLIFIWVHAGWTCLSTLFKAIKWAVVYFYNIALSSWGLGSLQQNSFPFALITLG